MSVLALIVALLAFVALLKLLGAAEAGGDAIRIAHAAVGTMSAPDLSDDEKEVRVREAAGRLFRRFVAIAGIAAVALGVPAVIVWAGSAIGLYPLHDVAAVATGWPFLLASTLGGVAAWIALERLR